MEGINSAEDLPFKSKQSTKTTEKRKKPVNQKCKSDTSRQWRKRRIRRHLANTGIDIREHESKLFRLQLCVNVLSQAFCYKVAVEEPARPLQEENNCPSW